jgi:organic hydroperoxide reductase OsmC/OhrA
VIGATHAGCFTMALSLILGEAQLKAERMGSNPISASFGIETRREIEDDDVCCHGLQNAGTKHPLA